MSTSDCISNRSSEHDGFTKFIYSRGQGEATPNLGAVCVYSIFTVDELDLSGVEMSDYKLGGWHEVTIGEGDCFLAEHFDKVLMTMKTGESAKIDSKVDPNAVQFINIEKGLSEKIGDLSTCKFMVFLKSFKQAPSQNRRSEPVIKSEHDEFTKYIIEPGLGEATPKLGAVAVCAIFLMDELKPSKAEMSGYKIGVYHEVTIGEGDCLLAQHFDKVLMTMKPGERAHIESKVDHNAIPITEVEHEFSEGIDNWGNTKFIITLQSFKEAPRQDDNGNSTELPHKDPIDRAIETYKNALIRLKDPFETLSVELGVCPATVSVTCHLNLAAALLKKKEFKGVVKHCTKALKIAKSSENSLYHIGQALYYRGQALLKLERTEEAKADLIRVRQLEPNNREAKWMLLKIM